MKILFLMADGFCIGDAVSQAHAYAAALQAGHEVSLARAAGPCALVEPLLERLGVRLVPRDTAEEYDLVLSGRITPEQFQRGAARVRTRRFVVPRPLPQRADFRHADLGLDALRRAGLFLPVPDAPLAGLLSPRRPSRRLIAPGTSPGRRAARWPFWPEFLRADTTPVTLCGDAHAVESWQADLPPQAQNRICCTARLEDVLPLLAETTLVLSPDTGIAHLAAACGVPTLTIFRAGQSRPENGMPYGPRARGLVEPTPDDVLDAARQMEEAAL